MKKIFILIAIIAITASVSAQVKVHPYNMVTINAQTQDWWPALRITVPTKSSCAYNLWNNAAGYNKDVFFVCGEGYLWTLKGGFFGSDISLKKNITPIEEALNKVISLQGAELKSYNITNKGIGNIIIQGSELPAGMYMYTLLVNNKIVDTKKMILTK